MRDRDTVILDPHDVTVSRHGGRTKRDFRDRRVSVAMQEDGATLTLFFDPDRARSGDARLLEVRVTPTAGGNFEPWRLLPQLPHHVQYARASLAHRPEDVVAALRALRQLGKTRRGLSDDYLRFIAEQYESLVAEGEPYPIKALAELHRADKSTVSRWVSAARRRGLLGSKES
jgi:hypothetical protein